MPWPAAFALLASCTVLLVVGAGVTLGSAIEVESPHEGEVIGLAGAELLARFGEAAEIRVGTVRVLLNGADVTSEVDVGSNGAYGRLHGLLPGENTIRVEAFGRTPGPLALWIRQTRQVTVLFRPPLDLDRG